MENIKLIYPIENGKCVILFGDGRKQVDDWDKWVKYFKGHPIK